MIIEKIKSNFNNKKYHLISFTIPFFLTLLVFFYLRFIFLDKNIIFVSDMKSQYASLLTYLKNIFLGKENIFYSFSKGIGGGMIGTIAYYLTSPINIILLFFGVDKIYLASIFIISIKIGLSGLFMYIFLNYHFSKTKKIIIILFSTLYALSAYNVGYYFNIMWIDAVYMTPLVMIGIDKLINDNKLLLYGLSLFFIILTNYYIGYMICIFSIIYLFYQLFSTDRNLQKDQLLNILIQFGIISIFSVSLTTFLIIPAYKELLLTPKVGSSVFLSQKLLINFNVFDIISKLFLGSHGVKLILNNDTALIYSGIIVNILIIFYFFNSNIKFREKIYSFIVILIFVLSFSINYLNYIWHGFNVPQSFNYRYSFLFSFFIIFLSLKAFVNLNNAKLKEYFIASILIMFSSIIIFLLNYEYLNIYIIIINVGIALLIMFILYIYNTDKYLMYKKNAFKLLAILVFAELTFNFYYSINQFNYMDIKEYTEFNEIFGKEIVKIKKNENSKFYRIEKTGRNSLNDSLLLNYNGISYFLSTIQNTTHNFFYLNGLTQNNNSVIYTTTSPIIDSLFGVKYVIFYNDKNYYYEEIDDFKYSEYGGLFYGMKETDVSVTRNNNALSLGYLISNSTLNKNEGFLNSLSNISRITISELFLNTMVDDYNPVFSKIKYNKEDNNYSFVVENKNNIFSFVPSTIMGNQKIILTFDDGDKIELSSDDNSVFIIENKYEIGQKVSFKMNAYEGEMDISNSAFKNNLISYYFDYDVFQEKINILKQNQMEVLINNESYIKGEVIATEDKPILFTSIPYEPGWTAYVDGKKVDIVAQYNMFNGLKLTPGKHIVEFKFYPPGLNLGIVISLISFLLSALYFWKGNKLVEFIVKKYLKHEVIINYLIVGGLTTVIGVGSYALFAKILGIQYITSSVLSWIIAVIFAFFANKIYVFKSSGNYSREAIEFIKFRLLSLFIDVGLMYIFVSSMNIDDLISKVFVQVIIIGSNYIFSKLFIFKE